MPTTIKIEFPYTKLTDKQKSGKLDKFVQTVCALANTEGGRVTLYAKEETDCYSDSDIDDIKRRIEQKLSTTFGDMKMYEYDTETRFELSYIIYEWLSWSQPCTVNYNLHFPSEAQVIKVKAPSPEFLGKVVKGVLGRKLKLEDQFKFGQHHRDFVLGERVALRESTDTQLKKLKDEKSTKGCDLASRITNTTNKLTLYVSAFANGEGGHIYYGITNKDGWNVVEGQIVDDQNTIIGAVDKTIRKMLWEDAVPERGKQWEIFFEHVTSPDKDGARFVIVISIAPSPKAVFNEKPESYQVVGGKVIPLKYEDWKKKLLQHRFSDRSKEAAGIPQSVGRNGWSSQKAKTQHVEAIDKLVKLRNDGDTDGFGTFMAVLSKSKESTINMKIIIQQQQAANVFREGRLDEAEELLNSNKNLLRKSPDKGIYEVRRLVWMCVVKRSQGRIEDSESLYTSAMQNGALKPAMLISAWLSVHKAKTLEILISQQCDSEESAELIKKCEQHYIQALRETVVFDQSRTGVAALKHRVHINLAKLYLGIFQHRNTVTRKEKCTEDDLAKADKMLRIVDDSQDSKGRPMTQFCNCKYLLVKSERDIRNWEKFKDRNYLTFARRKCDEVLSIAEEKKFEDVRCFAKAQLSLISSIQDA